MNVTRRRFLILLGCITAVFLLAITGWHWEEQRRAQALYTTARQDASVVVGKMLDLDGSRLAIYALDYSYWDEMVTFVRERDPKWAQVNLIDSMVTFDASGLAVYDSNGFMVYSANDAKYPKLRLLDLSPGEIKRLFSRDVLLHFFTSTPYGLLEIRGAKIVPGEDSERLSPARGYWFVSRLWDSQHLKNLGALLSADVTLESPDVVAGQKGSDETALHVMVFREPLSGSDGSPIRILRISRDYGGISSLESSARGTLRLLILFAAAIILALYFLLARWVTRPIHVLSQAITTESATTLAELEREHSEFGRLASLVHDSFDQKQRLESEVRDRILAQETLRESEERFRAIYDTTSEAVMLLDENGYFDCNPRTLEVFGFENKDDFTAVHPAGVSPPSQPDGQDSLTAARAWIETALREGTHEFEWVHRRKNGEEFPAEVLLSAFELGGRRVLQARVRDITERKRADEALREANQFTQEIIGSAQEGIMVYDLELRIRAFNRFMERLAGVQAGDVLGRHPLEVFPFLRESGVIEAVQSALVGGTPPAVVFPYRTPDGARSGWTSSICSPLRNAKGEIIGVIVTVRETTEEKSAQEALEHVTGLMRNIIDTSPDFIFVKDVNLRSILCNEAYAKAIGKRPEDLLGKTDIENGWAPDLVHGDPSRGIRGFEADDRDALEGRTVHDPADPANVGGEVKVFDTVKLPLRDAAGGLIGVLGISRDITERKRAEDETLRVQAFLDAVVKGLPVAVFVKDADEHRFTLWNQAAEEIFGMTAGEVLGKNVYDLFPKEQADFFWAKDLEALSTDGVLDIPEEPADTPALGRRYLHTRKVRVTGPDGTAQYLLGMSEDITERRQAEEALREANQVTQEIIGSAQEGIMVFDRHLQCLVWNPFMERVSGAPAGDVLGRHPVEVFPFLRNSPIIESLESVLAGMIPDAVIFPYGPPNASRPVWTSSLFAPLRNAKGETIGVIATVREITEEKKAQDDLKLRNLLLSTIQEASIDGILVVDENTAIVSVNQRFAQMWEIPQEVLETHSDELALKSVFDRLSDPQAFMDKVQYLYSHQQESSRDDIALRDGRVFDRYSAPVLGPDVTYFGRVWYFRDVTERKQAEEALARHAADLARSNSDLQQFAYIASHDLQEPLRMVSSYIQLLAKRYEGKLDQDAGEFIGYAVDGTHRMQALINGLLDFSRVGTQGKLFERIDPESVMKAATDNLKVALQESGAVVTHDPLPTVVADAGQLTQLLQNLIGNAIKYHGDTPPKVHVSAEQSEAECIFSISDNGIGIAPEHFDRIFQIFQRLHAKGEYPGTGIGLALCKRIVERHNGRIWVESEVGKGSTFRFAIPCNLPTAEAAGIQALAA